MMTRLPTRIVRGYCTCTRSGLSLSATYSQLHHAVARACPLASQLCARAYFLIVAQTDKASTFNTLTL
jgi:hypothetical protein